jgi:hypothetical protein
MAINDFDTVYIPQAQHTYYVSCGICGDRLQDVHITGSYIMIKPCKRCQNGAIQTAVEYIANKIKSDIGGILKGRKETKNG